MRDRRFIEYKGLKEIFQQEIGGKVASPVMQGFKYDHLPTGQSREVSANFANLAFYVEEVLQQGPEKSTALRKLLEAKDAAVRQAILDAEQTPQS